MRMRVGFIGYLVVSNDRVNCLKGANAYRRGYIYIYIDLHIILQIISSIVIIINMSANILSSVAKTNNLTDVDLGHISEKENEDISLYILFNSYLIIS
jgi:hypothetical protein